MEIEKITSAILLPINIVAIKLDSSFEKIDIVLEINESEFLSSSNLILFDEIKAISIPEKNAENKRVIIIIVNVIYLCLIVKVPFTLLIS